jgi:EmrB/QacA subfamily drug resistance transporter
VNVALPVMRDNLGSSLSTMQWVVNAYMLTLASLILLGGSAGDRFGRRRVFSIGLVGFAAASLLCGLAPSASWLIAARLAQGAAGALLTPSSLAIIGAAYTDEARGPAIGTWAAAGALTTSLGPPLGGWLVDAVGWRPIFFINLPVAAAALLLGLKLPADRSANRTEPLDVRGAVLASVALGALSYGLIAFGEGRHIGGLIVIAVAAPAIWLFIRVEGHSGAPMMPLSLFRNRDFSGANALTVLLYAALIGALFLLPFMLIEAHGYGAMAAGAAFLPFSVIMGVGSRWAGGLAERVGSRRLLMIGPSITALGFLILGVSSQVSSYWTGFLPGLTLIGVGMTLSVAPLTTTVFDSAPNDQSGAASGINNAAARTGGLLAIAAIGLAFGSSNTAPLSGPSLANAYRWVMFAASALAALSALTASWTLTVRTGRADT